MELKKESRQPTAGKPAEQTVPIDQAVPGPSNSDTVVVHKDYLKTATVLDLVCEAIKVVALPRKGASLAAIKKWVLDHKNTDVADAKVSTMVKKAILKGLENGTIIRASGTKQCTGATGSFLLQKLTKEAKKAPKPVSEKRKPPEKDDGEDQPKVEKTSKKGEKDQPKSKKVANKVDKVEKASDKVNGEDKTKTKKAARKVDGEDQPKIKKAPKKTDKPIQAVKKSAKDPSDNVKETKVVETASVISESNTVVVPKPRKGRPPKNPVPKTTEPDSKLSSDEETKMDGEKVAAAKSRNQLPLNSKPGPSKIQRKKLLKLDFSDSELHSSTPIKMLNKTHASDTEVEISRRESALPQHKRQKAINKTTKNRKNAPLK